MSTYTCPMHPEIEQDTPGTCPKCHMDLVEKDSKPQTDQGLGETTWKSYMPLIVVIGIITLITAALTWRDVNTTSFVLANTLEYFMIGFFIAFASFKLIDLPGFAHGYADYDLLAKQWPTYGYIYPFIELFFAVAMIINFAEVPILWAELIIMLFSGLGVAIKIAKKEEFTCACLGTFLKVPLTTVTLVEDFGMAILAGVLLWLM